MTRPNIAHAVHIVNQFVSSPQRLHMSAIHRIIRHLPGIESKGLCFPSSSSFQPRAFADSDWASCPDTHSSSRGWCIFVHNSHFMDV